MPHLPHAQIKKVLTLEQNLPIHDPPRRIRHQPHYRQRRNALPTSRFTHQPDRLTLRRCEDQPRPQPESRQSRYETVLQGPSPPVGVGTTLHLTCSKLNRSPISRFPRSKLHNQSYPSMPFPLSRSTRPLQNARVSPARGGNVRRTKGDHGTTGINNARPCGLCKGPLRRDLCKTLGFPPLAGEMSEGQRGLTGRQTPTIPVHTGYAKDPRRERATVRATTK